MSRRARLGAVSDALVLAVATGLSGILSYLFIRIGNSAIGLEAMSPVGVLWTLWALTGAVITFPVQHGIIREVAATGDEAGLARQRRTAVRAVTVVTVLLALVLVPAGDLVFTARVGVFVAMALLLPVGSMLVGGSRGVLAARSRFGAVAAGVLGENGIRVVLALVVLVVPDARVLGLALLAGFLVVLAWPSALSVPASTRRGVTSARMMGGLAGGMLGSQVVLTSGTLLVPLLGGTGTQVTTLFTALALVRGPYMLMIGVATRLTRPLTVLVTSGHRARLRRVELTLVGLTLAGTAVAALVGPTAFAVALPLLGPGAVLPDVAARALAAGSVLALASLLQTVVLIARERTVLLTAAWSGAVVAGGVAMAAWSADPVTRVAVGFVAAEVVAWLVMVVPGRGPVGDVHPEALGQFGVGPGEIAGQ